MSIRFKEPSLLMGTTDMFLVVEPGEIWEREHLFGTFANEPEIIEVIPLGKSMSASEQLMKVNNIIDTIQERGVRCFNNTYLIPRIV